MSRGMSGAHPPSANLKNLTIVSFNPHLHWQLSCECDSLSQFQENRPVPMKKFHNYANVKTQRTSLNLSNFFSAN